ncbi:MAG: polyphosphate kinase 1 [Acidimicrobiaceae bacterium]|nr:polyphosphate kinase 1 [Acidimicrobiaceae bacterium]
MIRVGGWAAPLTDYFSREISWLAFNARVLALADDADVPLLEQARYLSIFATNLDEFFQVRVSGLADRVAAELTERTLDGHTPAEQLREVRRIAAELCAEQQRLFIEKVRPALKAEGIHLLTPDEISQQECAYLRDHFEQRVFPVLTPLAVDPGHPFPFISDLSLSLAVLMRDPVDSEQRFARVKVPDTLDRWVETGEGSCRIVALEDVIAANLDMLFPGMEVLEHHSFRVTRNADLTLNDEDADDLLIAVQMELRRRRFQWAIRLEVADTMSDEVLDLLLRELNLRAEALVRVRGPIDLSGLNEIAGLPRPELTWPHWRGITEPELLTEDGPADFFKVLRSGDLLVHHPYSSFSRSVGALIRQAARDPAVLAIKLTLYRTSGDSPIIDALVAAAERGKQVAVLVELKARFDEAQNIGWAKRLEQAGAHVAYGLVGLKIHAKIAMIVREEPDGIRRYCHIGTGNYNHRTARIYEDFGLLTANPGVGADVASLFNQLTGYGRNVDHKHLITAPEQLRPRLTELIEQEMHVPGGRIIMKLNSLADGPMIDQLYKASQAGVAIDLIVRGLCGLRPGVAGLSETIRVRSIVGRFLEHSRIYHFANGDGPGRPATYIGSADLLSRNLDRRVEALVRVDDPRLAARVVEVAEVSLSDEHLAWTLDSEGVWTRHDRSADTDTHVRLQQLALNRARPAERVLP